MERYFQPEIDVLKVGIIRDDDTLLNFDTHRNAFGDGFGKSGADYQCDVLNEINKLQQNIKFAEFIMDTDISSARV